jgi:hypothetical protein
MSLENASAMPQLTDEHINFIIKDLSYRGVVQDDVREEMLDHICCVVETEMNSGKRFYDAYHLETHGAFISCSVKSFIQKQKQKVC